MTEHNQPADQAPRYDVSIIRPELRAAQFKLRGEGMPPERLKKLKKALRTLHTLETMAVNIYKSQLTRKRTDLAGP